MRECWGISSCKSITPLPPLGTLALSASHSHGRYQGGGVCGRGLWGGRGVRVQKGKGGEIGRVCVGCVRVCEGRCKPAMKSLPCTSAAGDCEAVCFICPCLLSGKERLPACKQP